MDNVSPWFFMNSDFRRSLGERIKADCMLVPGGLQHGVNARQLLESGCVDGLTRRHGRTIISSDFRALIHAQLDDAIATWVSHLPERVFDEIGWEFRDESRYYLKEDRYKSWLKRAMKLKPLWTFLIRHFAYFVYRSDVGLNGDEGLLLYLIYGKRSLGRGLRWIRNIDEKSVFHLLLLLNIYGEYELVEKELKHRLNKPASAYDLLGFAKISRDYLVDPQLVLDCLQMAEATISENGLLPEYDWMRCASGWLNIAGDDQQARRCMTNAEESRSPLDCSRTCFFTGIAGAWMMLFNDKARASEALKQAEKDLRNGSLVTSYSWELIAEQWLMLFDNEYAALSCMKEAEKCIRFESDYLRYQRAWQKLFNDNIDDDLLDKRLNSADCHIDPHEVALCYQVAHRDDSKAWTALENAEESASNSSDWCKCGETWLRLFNEKGSAERCFRNAEAMAQGCWDWLICARSWREISFRKSDVKNCIKQAETLAQDSSDWRHCAEKWVELLKNRREYRRCMAVSERLAQYPIELRYCAHLWLDAMGDSKNAARCLKESEKLIHSCEDWKWDADFWQNQLDNETEAENCLKRLEDNLFSSIDDILNGHD